MVLIFISLSAVMVFCDLSDAVVVQTGTDVGLSLELASGDQDRPRTLLAGFSVLPPSSVVTPLQALG